MPAAVGLNFIGFHIPLLASTFIGAILSSYRRFRITQRSLAYCVVALSAIFAVNVVLYQAAPHPESLSIPQDWSVVFMAGSGLLYAAFFQSKRLIPIGMLECYAIGTFAMVLDDAARTFVIGLPVSLPVVYWGGNGAGDMVLQLGIIMAAAYSALSGGLGVWRRNLVQRMVDEERAERFWERPLVERV